MATGAEKKRDTQFFYLQVYVLIDSETKQPEAFFFDKRFYDMDEIANIREWLAVHDLSVNRYTQEGIADYRRKTDS